MIFIDGGIFMDLDIKICDYDTMFNILKKDAYMKCLREIQKRNLIKLRKKRKIKIAFQVSCISEWIGDEILTLFSSDERFDVTIVLVWRIDTIKEIEFNQIIEHFTTYKNEKINYVIADGNVLPKDYDILFFTSPYVEGFQYWGRWDIPLSTLVCYIPYGYLVADIQQVQFNLFLHNILWKNFTVSKYYIQMAKKYCYIGDYGMLYAGYPKMDAVIYHVGDENIWKICGDKNKVKKIIYAPHHSINEMPYHSTFPKNYKFMLEYAKKHTSTTSWIFKPHPQLKYHSEKNGIFQSMDEYNEYVKEWDSLPNGRTLDGMYVDIFLTSDCMIFDSQSFMAEYLFVDKPSLYLMRENINFNEFGNEILEHLYTVAGDDFDGIANFIEKIAFSDPKKKLRKKFFDEYLDYYKDNKMTASEYIYRNIAGELK